MKTITVKVPEELDAELTALAARRKESKSALIRMALEQIVVTDGKTATGSSLDLIRDQVGCVEGLRDLSSNKDHFKGYGK